MSEQEQPLVGQTIDGRYRVSARIGSGGMGVVYRAQQLNVGRDVAIKVLRRERLGEERAVAQFVEEAQAVSQLRSPHSVTLIDVGEFGNGHAFLVMELVEGITLRQLLAERTPSLDEAVDIVEAIAQALGEAHARGIVHRDIKPSNVMLAGTLGHDAFVKVLDYGLAASFGDRTHRAGTPAYMAPELVADGSCTAASDVYALGVLLYELISGAPPFSGSTEQILDAHLHAHPPLGTLTLSSRLRKLLSRTLSKHPRLRPRDARTFRAELLRATQRPVTSPSSLAPDGSGAASPGPETLTTMASLRGDPPHDDGPSARRPSRRWLVAGAVLVLTVPVAASLSGSDAPQGPEGAASAHFPVPTASPAAEPDAGPSPAPKPRRGVDVEAPVPSPARSAASSATSTEAPSMPPASLPTSASPRADRSDDYGERLEDILPPAAPSSSGFSEKVDAILD